MFVLCKQDDNTQKTDEWTERMTLTVSNNELVYIIQCYEWIMQRNDYLRVLSLGRELVPIINYILYKERIT